MITHHEGKRYSVNYTVRDKTNNEYVLSSVTDAMKVLGISKNDAYALLHGECRIQGFEVIREDEVEI